MKHLYLIGGTMGVGKTTVSQILKRELPDCVFLDGDWCWDADPFQVTEDTKRMVLENIIFLLNQFLRCPAYKNIVFCWVMHQQEILDRILEGLKDENETTPAMEGSGEGVSIHAVSLVCEPSELTRRLEKDVKAGIRRADVIERSLSRLPLYMGLNTRKIDVTDLTPEETALAIRKAGQDERNGGIHSILETV